MKKLIVLTIVFVLLSVTFIPAMAKGPSGNRLYALAGYITAINNTNKTITVKVMVGNSLADDYLYSITNQPVIIKTYTTTTTISTTLGTFTLEPTRLLLSGGTVITFDKFQVGDPISSNGYFIDNTWHAIRVTKGALLIKY